MQVNNAISGWIISNLAWWLLTLIICSAIPGIGKVIYKTSKIIMNNRPARGAERGKHFADRFIDIWFSKENEPLPFEMGVFYRGFLSFTNYSSVHYKNVIDIELSKLGLIQIIDNYNGNKIVKPIRSWINKCVFRLTIFILVIFQGDDKKSYKNRKVC